MTRSLFTRASVLLGTVASGIPLPNATSSGVLQWGSCETITAEINSTGPITTLPLDCSTLTVPLDYTSSSDSRQLNLSLVRYKATQEPVLGNVLINPGGPGGSGVEFLVQQADLFAAILGPQFNVIGFDPRGTGKTIPFNCNSTALSALNSTYSQNLTQELFDNWDTTLQIAQLCHDLNTDTGEYITTSFVARDMLAITEALGQKNLQYFGTSYGTQLGQTFAAMFPDRVDRMLLDSVVNPHDYVDGQKITWEVDTDKTWTAFFSECVTAPNACNLRKYANVTDPTAAQLRADVEAALNAVLALGPQYSRVYAAYKGVIQALLYAPRTWLTLANAIEATLDGSNATVLATLNTSPKNAYDIPSTAGALWGIGCTDTTWRASSPEDIIPVAQQAQGTSYFSDIDFTASTMPCAAWKFNGKEVYTGDFVAKTANPILFVVGAHDPVTPMASAFNASAGFEGSVVLKNNGFGHSLISDVSNCTIRYVNKYFTTGALPPVGTICEPNQRPFDIGWTGPGSPYQSEPLSPVAQAIIDGMTGP